MVSQNGNKSVASRIATQGLGVYVEVALAETTSKGRVGSGSRCAHGSCRTGVSGLILSARRARSRRTFAPLLASRTAALCTERKILLKLESRGIIFEELNEVVKTTTTLQSNCSSEYIGQAL